MARHRCRFWCFCAANFKISTEFHRSDSNRWNEKCAAAEHITGATAPIQLEILFPAGDTLHLGYDSKVRRKENPDPRTARAMGRRESCCAMADSCCFRDLFLQSLRNRNDQ